MPRSALTKPTFDPTPIFEFARSSFATELLAAAVTHFAVFDTLAETGPISEAELGQRLGLQSRPLTVLLTMLRSMQLLDRDAEGRVQVTPIAHEHLRRGAEFDISEYLALSAELPSVKSLVERLRTNSPTGTKPDEKSAYIYRKGIDTSMEEERSARFLTMALAGRAKNCAPYLAEGMQLHSAERLLDVAGGSGLYAIACLQQYPHLRAMVWDRPAVLKIAAETAAEYGVADRLECIPGDMFHDPVPGNPDVILLSNVLHDWDIPQCEQLVSTMAAALPANGRLVVHDVYLNDALDGPKYLAEYSAALFTLTEGRAYSVAEYRTWLMQAGLTVDANVIPTLVHCGLINATKLA
ncbi:methyltransferase [Tuwongella immobilis]|uniref:O-methyltransferase domain-containing protein n=1 Tax=Tuwongella immobilis TaxID=692036 RepID=A0A6C2YKU4_9BACT|nr:methyltransferase [Tuwongella immobilis]VIP01532.1 o-methyltransferase family 2 : Methylase involved in ubiquinone/menaquinone biosynthesis OS=Singulisphaera acidiphila (strain ATCC BAA-1392 / DSM 18658 / VKM B-2454 / MOB10) GN=Sinac_6199 PE=4 SV=1: Methyltransf_2 [Tuwongella immobilis]VTR98688.1 o-methyltransferase family 2 : Methylase involved in ubiquinone/menaquinone biosynthesis OS=Singulisphaera acidiphila (strain ATCC BAA-1392 / DSM 18658 / VKM B-2454 / MOB10) GN=Sinac_6199 PE=4 SV=1: M